MADPKITVTMPDGTKYVVQPYTAALDIEGARPRLTLRGPIVKAIPAKTTKRKKR